VIVVKIEIRKWKSLKRHFFQVEIKRSLPNIKDYFTKKQLHGHLEMVLLLAKIKKIKFYETVWFNVVS
jgi:hypothetical protein